MQRHSQLLPQRRSSSRHAQLLTAAAAGLVSAACAGGPGAQSKPMTMPMTMPAKVAVGIDQCVPTVLAKYPGEALQVVLKPEDGQPVWEIEVETKDGMLHDVECSGVDGRIIETERRFRSASEAGFKDNVRVSEADAQKTALAKYPGTVERVEYELESDGAPVYEFDIQMANGQDMRVEVNAVTGELHEGHAELVEVGRLSR